MRFSGVSALAIWNNAVRTLSGLGAANPIAVAVTTIAAASSVDVRTGAGTFGVVTVAAKTGGAATLAITLNLWDGTTPIVVATSAAAANSPVAFHFGTNVTSGPRITNTDGANAGTYLYAGYQLIK